MERRQKKAILQDLDKKMVFLSGPRQSGKTWLAKDIASHFKSSTYLNYDHLEDRKIIHNEAWLASTDLLILDELHKMSDWKNYLKGVYDKKSPHLKILVTGSARLDVLKQVGDSLAGRYFSHRLLPFSPAELSQHQLSNDLNRFIEHSGFPEPCWAANMTDVKRWRSQYIDSLMRVDIFDFNHIHDLKSIQLVLELLRSKVGSPVSFKSIAEDVGVSPNTVKKYIQIFEALYIIFRVTPFSKNIARSLLKEPKIYFFDTGLVNGDNGAKLENLVATCLLKDIYGKVDYQGEPYALHYLRTKEGKEVDFAIVHHDEIQKMIEVKYADKQLSANLLTFHEKYHVPAVQVVQELKQERIDKNIEIRNVLSFLKALDY